MITKKDFEKVRAIAMSLKAIVIGDAMLDRYITGIVERMSPEAPVPVLTHEATEIKAGGAANVALNLASWGCETSLIGMIGKDSNGEDLKTILSAQKIKHHFYQSENRPTTVKTRIVAASHHLLRIDEESSDYLEGKDEEAVLKHIHVILAQEKPDLIILEDYNKGFLTKEVISLVIQYGRQHKVFVAVDPKEKNFLEFNNADLFKPNLREAELAANKTLDPPDLHELTSEWLDKMKFHTIAITLGGQGVFLHNQADNVHVRPSRSIEVVDVCGAGDAVITTLALAQISGLNLEKSGELANLIGAYVCSHSGVVTVDLEQIELWI